MSTEPHKKYDFGSALDELNAEDWMPDTDTSGHSEAKLNLDQVRQIAEKEGFTSREPKSASSKEAEGQITIRGKQQTMDEFRAFAAAQEPKWPLGYTLERALAALKREIGK